MLVLHQFHLFILSSSIPRRSILLLSRSFLSFSFSYLLLLVWLLQLAQLLLDPRLLSIQLILPFFLCLLFLLANCFHYFFVLAQLLDVSLAVQVSDLLLHLVKLFRFDLNLLLDGSQISFLESHLLLLLQSGGGFCRSRLERNRGGGRLLLRRRSRRGGGCWRGTVSWWAWLWLGCRLLLLCLLLRRPWLLLLFLGLLHFLFVILLILLIFALLLLFFESWLARALLVASLILLSIFIILHGSPSTSLFVVLSHVLIVLDSVACSLHLLVFHLLTHVLVHGNLAVFKISLL